MSLHDDAFKVAEDVGVGKLIRKNGVPKLVETTQEAVKTNQDQKTKEIYQEGLKK